MLPGDLGHPKFFSYPAPEFLLLVESLLAHESIEVIHESVFENASYSFRIIVLLVFWTRCLLFMQ